MSTYEDKKAFFTQLDALSTVENDELNEEELLQRRTSRAFFISNATKPLPRTALRPEPASTPRRIHSAPIIASSSLPDVIEVTPSEQITRAAIKRATAHSIPTVEETLVPDSARLSLPALQRSSTTPLPSRLTLSDSSPSTRPGMKRKRQTKEDTMTEKPQIFGGLSFFYLPNNDVAPVRKMRIQSAMEHGATWVRRPADATHIIIDKNLKYKDVENKLQSSNGCPVIVNEDFPLDCISWKRVLNPAQPKYKVPGSPSPQVPATGRGTEQEPRQRQTPQKSLPLDESQRVPKQWEHAWSGDIPPREVRSVQGTRQTMSKTLRANSRGDLDANVPSDEAPAKLVDNQRHTTRDEAIHMSRIRSTKDRQAEVVATEDELSKYIELAKDYQGLPLDSEEDDELEPREETEEVVSAPDRCSDVESDVEAVQKKRGAKENKSGRKNITFEDRFVCHTGGTLDKAKAPPGPNARTIEILQSMCAYYERTDDHWRHQSYRKAITLLKAQSVKITTVEQAMALPGIGRRLAEKIVEIVNTDKLEKLEIAKNDPHIRTLELFMGIYDVGNSRARQWIDKGFRTLDDIREKADITSNQRLGLEHYEDLNSRIPRREMDCLGEYVKKEAAKINPNVELLIGGSYRRGSSSSGDIDFIVTQKGTISTTELVPFLNELVDNLMQQRFVTAVLASLHAYRPGKDGPGSKWHGCCVLPRIPGGFNDNESYRPVWRRIDFLLVPETEYGAALLYFTGNDIFNRSMRLLASKKGMRLNQRGLYKNVLRGPNRVKCTEGSLLEGRDEKRIFEILGVKWREPEERWC